MELLIIVAIIILILYKINKDIVIGIKWSIIYLFFIEWLLFNVLYFNSSVKIVEDFIVGGIFLKTIKDYGRNKTLIPGYLKFTIVLIFISITLSAVLNYSTFLSLALGIRRLLIFFVLLYSFSKLDLTIKAQNKIIKYFYVVGIIQLPFVLIEFFFWNTIAKTDRPGLGGWDANTGTFPFSGQQSLSIFILFIIFYLIAEILFIKNTNKWKTMLIILYLSIVLPLASSGGSMAVGAIVFLLFFIVLFFTYYKLSIMRIVLSFIPVFSIGYIFYYLTENTYQGQLDYLFNFQSLVLDQATTLGREGDQGRIAVIFFVWQQLLNSGSLLLGYGPGNFLAADYIGQQGQHFDPNLLMAGRIQITALLGEVGLITTILIVVFFVLLLIYLFHNYLKKKSNRLINMSAFNFTLIFFGCFIYITSLGSIQLVLPLTFILGTIFKLNLYQQQE